MSRALQEPKSPMRELLTIALPTIATMFSFTLMQFVDALMVSKIGPEPHHVAAQGNGGMANWLLLSVFFGISTVINTYVSQNVGANRPEQAARYGWAGVWMGVCVWPVMLIAAWLMPALMGGVWQIGDLRLGLGHEGELLRAEVIYAQILLVGSLLKLVNKGTSEFFFGIHRPIVVTISVVAGNLANIVANYVLIFGRVSIPALDGIVPGWSTLTEMLAPVDEALPALGVAGAAIGTIIGYLVECVIQTSVFLSRAYHKTYSTRSAWRHWTKQAKEVLKLGWPAGLMMGNETFCWWFLMSYLLGAGGAAAARHAGVTDPDQIREAAEVSNAVGWIGLRYMHAAFMPTVGLSIAITAIVGKYMGMGRVDLAESRSWLALRVALGYMGLCAVLMVVFRVPLIEVFLDRDASEAQRASMMQIGSGVMIAAAVFQLTDAVGIMLIGALRGAGDTKWPGVVTVVLSWVVLTAGGLILVWLAPGLGSLGPWIAAAAYITALGAAMLWRFLRGPWREIRLVESEKEAVGASTVQAMTLGTEEGLPAPASREE